MFNTAANRFIFSSPDICSAVYSPCHAPSAADATVPRIVFQFFSRIGFMKPHMPLPVVLSTSVYVATPSTTVSATSVYLVILSRTSSINGVYISDA